MFTVNHNFTASLQFSLFLTLKPQRDWKRYFMCWMLKIPSSFRRKTQDCSSIQQNQVCGKGTWHTPHCLAHPKCVSHTHPRTSFNACVFHICTPDFAVGNPVLLSELWDHLKISETAEKREKKREILMAPARRQRGRLFTVANPTSLLPELSSWGWQCCSKHCFILSFRGRDSPWYTCSTLQRNPFSTLQVQDNIWQSKEELNLSELSLSVLVTEVQLFEISARCVREK